MEVRAGVLGGWRCIITLCGDQSVMITVMISGTSVMLRWSAGSWADRNLVFGAGKGAVWMNRVECSGNEIHLWDCPLSLKKHTDCSQKEHAGLTCEGQRETNIYF